MKKKRSQQFRVPPAPLAVRAYGAISWLFPPNPLGQDQGVHDAGVETFKGNFYRYLAREIIQNSLDARHSANRPVLVDFQRFSIKRSDIPDIDELQDVFRRCKDYWTEPIARRFFARAAQLAAAPTIEALRIADFNTTGLIGGDNDRTTDKNWYSLIRSSGSSSKLGGEGGSYGIGKNAPFAASNMRAVLYSTNTGNGKVAFQGVARLATHDSRTGIKASNIGYLGAHNGASVRDAARIPPLFQRSSRGTDVVILGFIAERTWEDQLRFSVLEDFWPAIHLGYLEVQLSTLKISKQNLAPLLEESVKEEGFSAHLYYESFIKPSQTFSSKLPHLKQVHLNLTAGQLELPKRVAMVRKSGMVIYHKHFRGPVPYCGVFICDNEHGNRLLRDMEPPRHDVWDPDFPEKGVNKYIEREFGDYIRQCIKDLAGKDDSKTITVPELSRFLPDDEESPEDPLGGPEQAERDKVEGFPKQPPAPKARVSLPVNPMPKRRPVSIVTSDGDEPDDDEGHVKNGEPPGRRRRRPKPHRRLARPTLPLQFRSFATDQRGQQYCITIRPTISEKKTGVLNISMVGDDTKEPVRLRAVCLGTKRVPFGPNGRVGPLPLIPGRAMRLQIELEEAANMVIEVAAHEA